MGGGNEFLGDGRLVVWFTGFCCIFFFGGGGGRAWEGVEIFELRIFF